MGAAAVSAHTRTEQGEHMDGTVMRHGWIVAIVAILVVARLIGSVRLEESETASPQPARENQVFDTAEAMMVRSCMPGTEAIEKWSSPSNTMAS